MIGKASSIQPCCWVNGCHRCLRSRARSSSAVILPRTVAPHPDGLRTLSIVVSRRPIELLAAVVGASSLGAEIAAARLLAPWFGASTIVWANTIATVLVALSIGYALGGRLADRNPTMKGLARWVLWAAAMLALVPFASGPFLRLSVRAFDNL